MRNNPSTRKFYTKEQENQLKHEAITCILGEHKRLYNSSEDVLFNVICSLYPLSLGDLNQILGDLISDLASELAIK